jgi:hypothetical protein
LQDAAVRDLLKRFVILATDGARLAVSLYVLHTHAFKGRAVDGA